MTDCRKCNTPTTTSPSASAQPIDMENKSEQQIPGNQSLPEARTSRMRKLLHQVPRMRKSMFAVLRDNKRAIAKLVLGILAIGPFAFALQPAVQQVSPLFIDLEVQNSSGTEINCSVVLGTEGKGRLDLTFPTGTTEFDMSINRTSANVSYFDRHSGSGKSPERSCVGEECGTSDVFRHYSGTVWGGRSLVRIELDDLATRTHQGYGARLKLAVSTGDDTDGSADVFHLDLTTQHELSISDSHPQPEGVYFGRQPSSQYFEQGRSAILYDYGELGSGTPIKWEFYDSRHIEARQHWSVVVSAFLGIGISLIAGGLVDLTAASRRNREEDAQ